jgi:creatinine amidohydrolase
MRYSDLTYEELRDLVPQVGGVFFPLGCTEQQGPHLPTDFDTWMITRLCQDIAERLQQEHSELVLVMPTLPFGPTPEHVGFGFGYVNLRQSTHEAVVQDVLESLGAQGFGTLILWRGCGQHDLKVVIDRFNASHEDCAAYQPVIDYGAVCNTAFGHPIPGGHADSFATSIRQYLDEAGVRSDKVRAPTLQPFDWGDDLDFSAISDTGVIGDPAQASAEAGARIWELCVREGVHLTTLLLGGRVDQVRQTWHFLP